MSPSCVREGCWGGWVVGERRPLGRGRETGCVCVCVSELLFVRAHASHVTFISLFFKLQQPEFYLSHSLTHTLSLLSFSLSLSPRLQTLFLKNRCVKSAPPSVTPIPPHRPPFPLVVLLLVIVECPPPPPHSHSHSRTPGPSHVPFPLGSRSLSLLLQFALEGASMGVAKGRRKGTGWQEGLPHWYTGPCAPTLSPMGLGVAPREDRRDCESKDKKNTGNCCGRGCLKKSKDGGGGEK